MATPEDGYSADDFARLEIDENVSRSGRDFDPDRIHRGPPLFCHMMFVVALIMCGVSCYLISESEPAADANRFPRKLALAQFWMSLELYSALGFIAAGGFGNVLMLFRQRLGVFFGWVMVTCASLSAISTVGYIMELDKTDQPQPGQWFWVGYAWRLTFTVMFVIALLMFWEWAKKLATHTFDRLERERQAPVFCTGMFVVALAASGLLLLVLASSVTNENAPKLPPKLAQLQTWLTVDFYSVSALILIGIIGNVSLLLRQRFGLYCGWLMLVFAMISAFITIRVWMDIRGFVSPSFAMGFLVGFSWRMTFIVLYLLALLQFASWQERLSKIGDCDLTSIEIEQPSIDAPTFDDFEN